MWGEFGRRPAVEPPPPFDIHSSDMASGMARRDVMAHVFSLFVASFFLLSFHLLVYLLFIYPLKPLQAMALLGSGLLALCILATVKAGPDQVYRKFQIQLQRTEQAVQSRGAPPRWWIYPFDKISVGCQRWGIGEVDFWPFVTEHELLEYRQSDSTKKWACVNILIVD